MSLGTKITIFAVVFVALGFASLTAVVLQLEYKHLTSEAREQALSHLKTFAKASRSVDWIRKQSSKRRIAHVVENIFRDPNVVYLVFQDLEGHLLYSSQTAPDVASLVHKTRIAPHEQKALEAAGFWARPSFIIGDEPVTELLRVVEGRGIARLGLREGKTQLAVSRFTKAAAIRLFAINGCAVLAALLAAMFFARSVDRPIRQARGKLLQILEGHGASETSGAHHADLSLLAREVEAIQGVVKTLEAKPTELVGTLSHEIRSPLQSILGYVGLIKQGQTGPVTKEMREYLEAVEESVTQFKSFTDGALDLVRLEQGHLQLDQKPFELEKLAKGAMRLFVPEARMSNIHLKARVANNIWVLGDSDRTYHALVNLLSNSMKFTPEGGQITIDSWVEDGKVRVRVSDTGIGMSPEDAKKAFGKFHQLNGHKRLRGGQGLGLGLSLVRSVLEAQNGKIWIESQEGKGTEVHFSLPHAKEKA